MLVKLLLFVLIVLASGKTRKGPLPHELWEKIKDLPVDEDESKIVGGELIEITDRPFQVAFLYNGNLRCGGAWLGGNVVLTAAHCCNGVSASKVSVRLGSSFHAQGGEVIDVAEVREHEDFDSYDLTNDACLLILANEPTSNIAAPAELVDSEDAIPTGASFEVSGWGTTTSGGSISPQLRQVTVPYVLDEDCNSYNMYDGRIVGECMICAGEYGKDSCQGDSGGPMTWNGKHVGIVSWGIGCAMVDYPGVYGETQFFLDWITTNSK